jgi:hypothetical protein
MNLQEIRARYESRIASIEHEMFELLGKLNKVNEVLTIASQLGGDSPVTYRSIERASTAAEAVTPAVTAQAPKAANEDEVVAEARVVEMPREAAASPEPVMAEHEVVAEAPAAETPQEEAASPEPVIETVEEEAVSAEPVIETVEEEAVSPEPVIETVEEEAVSAESEVEAVEEEAVSPEPVIEAVEQEVVAEAPEPETPQEEAASAEPVIETVEEEVVAEAPAAETAESAPEAKTVDAASLEKTDQFEQLFESALGTGADDDGFAGTDQLDQIFDSAESEAELDEAADDALSSLREKLASAANEEQPKSPFMSLGKFLNRAK